MEPLDFVMRALDQKKRTAPNGEDYWMGRDIQAILGYTEWRNFESVIKKAKMACDGSGVQSSYHFVETNKLISAGKGAELERADCYLTRYACYLIAMNGDSSKPEVAAAQAYFAVQTRRQELSEQEKRVALRERVRVSNKILAGTAERSGRYSIRFVQRRGLSRSLWNGTRRHKAKEEDSREGSSAGPRWSGGAGR